MKTWVREENGNVVMEEATKTSPLPNDMKQSRCTNMDEEFIKSILLDGGDWKEQQYMSEAQSVDFLN